MALIRLPVFSVFAMFRLIFLRSTIPSQTLAEAPREVSLRACAGHAAWVWVGEKHGTGDHAGCIDQHPGGSYQWVRMAGQLGHKWTNHPDRGWEVVHDRQICGHFLKINC